ncbi:hypothetical protein KDK77_01660 [bacterium]|nr:hypothetical protein [bacterium]
MWWFIGKIVISGTIIAFASWLAGKQPVLAGFIVALPLMSMMSIFFSYVSYKDMDTINKFALSIVTAVPLSLTFFIPFICNRWLNMNFLITYGLGFCCVIAAYVVHGLIFNSGLFR